MPTVKPRTFPPKQLVQSIDTAATSIVLDNILDWDGETEATQSMFGSRLFAVLTNPTKTRLEIIELDPSTIANDSITVLGRGLGLDGSYTPVTANKLSWVAGETIVQIGSDAPQLFQSFQDYIDAIALGSAPAASDSAFGYTKISENLSTKPRAMAALVSEQGTPGMTLAVRPFAIASADVVVSYAGGNTGAFSAPASNPRIDLVVYSTTGSALATRTGTEAASPSEPTPTSGDIVLASVYHRVGETSLKERDDSTNGYIKRWYQPGIYNAGVLPAGTIIESAAKTTPSGYLLADGSAVSRSTYANLFNAICPSQNFTVTIASPGVVTATAHGLVLGDKIHFTTTGGLPSGMSTNTDYYVISAGLTTDAFQFALSPGGAAVNTTGSQSGTHTLYKSAYGKGDGSTTFTLPDRRGRVAVGIGSASTITLSFESAAVDTSGSGGASSSGDLVTILDTVFPSQGQKVQLTTTGTLPTGLSTSTDYWIIRKSSTQIQFAASQADANDAISINLTGAGSGVHTMTFTQRSHTVQGRVFGEETHGISTSELSSHSHTIPSPFAGSSGWLTGTGDLANPGSTNSTGGDAQHNNMMPSIVQYFYIKT